MSFLEATPLIGVQGAFYVALTLVRTPGSSQDKTLHLRWWWWAVVLKWLNVRWWKVKVWKRNKNRCLVVEKILSIPSWRKKRLVVKMCKCVSSSYRKVDIREVIRVGKIYLKIWTIMIQTIVFTIKYWQQWRVWYMNLMAKINI